MDCSPRIVLPSLCRPAFSGHPRGGPRTVDGCRLRNSWRVCRPGRSWASPDLQPVFRSFLSSSKARFACSMPPSFCTNFTAASIFSSDDFRIAVCSLISPSCGWNSLLFTNRQTTGAASTVKSTCLVKIRTGTPNCSRAMSPEQNRRSGFVPSGDMTAAGCACLERRTRLSPDALKCNYERLPIPATPCHQFDLGSGLNRAGLIISGDGNDGSYLLSRFDQSGRKFQPATQPLPKRPRRHLPEARLPIVFSIAVIRTAESEQS